MKVIFLDFDGPMIPYRAYFLPNQTAPVSVFDPCAVSLLLRIVKQSNAKIVISSTWGMMGKERVVEVLSTNGIDPTLLHDDWITPRRMSSYRSNEIAWWLERHPEVTHHVAIDDEDLHSDFVPCAVLCDAYEGFSWRNYLECLTLLDAHEDEKEKDSALSYINWFKRREIIRTRRRDEKQWELIAVADQLHPKFITNDEN